MNNEEGTPINLSDIPKVTGGKFSKDVKRWDTWTRQLETSEALEITDWANDRYSTLQIARNSLFNTAEKRGLKFMKRGDRLFLTKKENQ